jgi:hypothetical protein
MTVSDSRPSARQRGDAPRRGRATQSRTATRLTAVTATRRTMTTERVGVSAPAQPRAAVRWEILVVLGGIHAT